MSNARRPPVPSALAGVDPARAPNRGPTIESARRRLGGRPQRASTRARGSLVSATTSDGTMRVGVMLFACDRTCDVWFEDGVVRRVRAQAIAPQAGAVPEQLARVAAEIRLFADLVEGDCVRWERADGVREGCIVEKCRYGAIVVTRDGRIVAVGFRKLWPAVVRGVA